MSGIHDMGGRPGMGPVIYEEDEPVFHASWEARVDALNRALRALGKWNIDFDRHVLETLPPSDYMRFSYYERWLARLEHNAVHFGLATQEELRSGKAVDGYTKQSPALTLASAARWLNRGIASSNDPTVKPRFAAGQRVRARCMQSPGHTRLPNYVQGKSGAIHRDHGVYVFPDTNAHFLGEQRQHVYSVQFAARELWGETAGERDCVFIDLWDNYLETV